jgi:hypothetical protein
MSLEVIVALCVVCAGFIAARAFRFRRMNARDERRRELRDEKKRERHFRGSLEFELEKGPPTRPGDDPPA